MSSRKPKKGKEVARASKPVPKRDAGDSPTTASSTAKKKRTDAINYEYPEAIKVRLLYQHEGRADLSFYNDLIEDLRRTFTQLENKESMLWNVDIKHSRRKRWQWKEDVFPLVERCKEELEARDAETLFDGTTKEQVIQRYEALLSRRGKQKSPEEMVVQLEKIYKSIKNRKGKQRSHRDAKTQFRKIFRNYEIPLKKALNDEKTDGDLKIRIQEAITMYREIEPAGASHASSAANQEAESSFESYPGEYEGSSFEDAMYGTQFEGGHESYSEYTF